MTRINNPWKEKNNRNCEFFVVIFITQPLWGSSLSEMLPVVTTHFPNVIASPGATGATQSPSENYRSSGGDCFTPFAVTVSEGIASAATLPRSDSVTRVQHFPRAGGSNINFVNKDFE